MRRTIFLLPLVFFICSTADAQRVAIDGRFADWDSLAVLASDPVGDGGSAGVDFTRLQADNDSEWLYLSFDTGSEMLIQDENSMQLAIDADANPATGSSVQGIGAELLWNFGNRSGTVRLGSSTIPIKHADIRLVPAPSMTSRRFEIALRRATVLGGRPLFTSDSIRIALADPGGDLLPDASGGATYHFHSKGDQAGGERLIRDPEAGSMRLLTWNTLFNGLLESRRQPAYTRMLRAMKPDIMCFQECFDISAADVLSFIQSILEPPAGRSWRALKRDQGDILVTHLDVDGIWQLQSEYREPAYLLRTPADEPLLLFNCHFRCCTANGHRQKEADGVIRFLRDAKKAGGSVTLSEGTPIVLVGDLNLVGDYQQYLTLINGDIVNNAFFGVDAPPDWDGGPWTELQPRHPSSHFSFTWDDDGSSFAPGKLDFILYTASVLDVTQNMLVDPRQISPGQRIRLGINESDAVTASDHLPRFADIRWKNSSAVEDAIPAAWNIGSVYPQPARRQLSVNVSAERRVALQFSLHDILGRNIALTEADTQLDAGTYPHRFALQELRPGMYFLRITDGTRSEHRPVIIE